MSTTVQTNRELAERYYGATVEAAQAMNPELLAEDVVIHDPMMPDGEMRGREAVGEYYLRVGSAFSNPRNEIEDIIATDEAVVVRYTMRGTHDRDEIMGVEPTGNEIAITGIDILRVEDGKIAECWSEMNVLGLMQQLGIMPEGVPAADD